MESKDWSRCSWRQRPAKQQPFDIESLNRELEVLNELPGLVATEEVENLKGALAQCCGSNGSAFVLTGGDCAESFSSCTLEDVRSKVALLHQMRGIIEHVANVPVLVMGRMAGQYAKPRSSDTECLPSGRIVCSFKGENVNGIDVDERTPDAERLIRGYYHSAATLNFARWSEQNSPLLDEMSQSDVTRLASKIYAKPVNLAQQTAQNKSWSSMPFYTAHEALVLPFEEAMTRIAPIDNKHVNLGGHFCWIGDRTRQIDGAHVEYMRGIANPIGVKVGPTLASNPDDFILLIRTLNNGKRVCRGKISVIIRLGAQHVQKMLPPLIQAAVSDGIAGDLVWICDPCHGNTKKCKVTGTKFREYVDIVREVREMHEALAAANLRLGGIHLELCGEPVTECTGGPETIMVNELAKRFGSTCDPRLNYSQSIAAAFEVSSMLRQDHETPHAPQSPCTHLGAHRTAPAMATISRILRGKYACLLSESAKNELGRLAHAAGAVLWETKRNVGGDDRRHGKLALRRINGLQKPVSGAVFGTLFLHCTKNPFALLDAAWEAGINAFDTARIYGAGECERILGQWMSSRNIPTEKIVIFAKGGCNNQDKLWSADISEIRIRNDIHLSCEALGLTTVDVYSLHRDDESVPVTTVVDMMDQFYKEGKFRAWGVSNWEQSRLRACIEYADAACKIAPICDSLQVSLAQPSRPVWPSTKYMLEHNAPWYARNNIAVLAWECLAKGFMAGKWNEADAERIGKDYMDIKKGKKRPLEPTGEHSHEWREMQLVRAYATKGNFKRRRRALLMATRTNATLPQIAMRYVVSQQYPCFALIGTTSIRHLKENVSGLQPLSLSNSEVEWLKCGKSEVSADGRRPRSLSGSEIDTRRPVGFRRH